MALTASSQSGSRSTVILVIVIALHVLVGYGIQSGLARKMVQLLPPDIQTKIIKEDKPDEPPPPPPPPPPDIQTPPPFVPPPEVSVQAPVQTTAIQTVTNVPPPITAPVMAPAPPVKQAVVVQPKYDQSKTRPSEDYYPPSSLRDGEEGQAQVKCFVGTDGKCTSESIQVTKSTGFERLDAAAIKYVKEGVRFIPGSTDGVKQGMWKEVIVTFKPKTSR